MLTLTLSSVATCAGQPPLFSNDWTINRACAAGSKFTPPDDLRYHLLIQRFHVRVNNARYSRSQTTQSNEKESEVLMKVLECDLEDLERDIGDRIGGNMCP